MAQTLVIEGLKRRRLPINLRQSGNSDAQMLISTRVRKSPWWHLSKAAGLLGLYDVQSSVPPKGVHQTRRWRSDGGVRVPHRACQHVGRGRRAPDQDKGSRCRGNGEHADHPRRAHPAAHDAGPVRHPLQPVWRRHQRPGAASSGRRRVLVQHLRLRPASVGPGRQLLRQVQRGHPRDGRVSCPDSGAQVGNADGEDVRPYT